MSAAHPSRSAPRCADCVSAREHSGVFYCDHASTPVSLETGGPLVQALHMRTGFSTPLHRIEPCGADGSLFVPRPICRTCGGSGRHREPYSRAATACLDCLTRPISTATATTDASENAPGSRD